ncbi:hypothetical protein [Mangrovicella endophytica]|uniref:hypothetical protein n=1 Tax=Mangrovicella endophytica TaxID=2066697 RepID=UPI000C9DAF44|nr:hypothetical protein [Mangrovicella endophytica]
MTVSHIALGTLACAAVIATAIPAGVAAPNIVRTVTLAGVQSPAYYSIVDKTYRFIGTPVQSAGSASTSNERIAGLDMEPQD